MRVNEYIYRNWANWNFAILKELCEDEGIEWSEELVAYLKTTPTNTNWSMLVNFGIEPYGSDEESGPVINFIYFDNTIIDYVIYQESEREEEYSNPYYGALGDTFYIPNNIVTSDGTMELSGDGKWTSSETGTEYSYGDTYEIQGSDTLTYGEPQE